MIHIFFKISQIFSYICEIKYLFLSCAIFHLQLQGANPNKTTQQAVWCLKIKR